MREREEGSSGWVRATVEPDVIKAGNTQHRLPTRQGSTMTLRRLANVSVMEVECAPRWGAFTGIKMEALLPHVPHLCEYCFSSPIFPTQLKARQPPKAIPGHFSPGLL